MTNRLASMNERVTGRRHPAKALKGFQNLRKLTVKSLQRQARGTGSGRLRGLSGDKAGEAGRRPFSHCLRLGR
ncbi:MAG: hypothetical protein EOR67_09975 [Mesorhizobium sp.]|uniref:hypothetical protein n=1 Tax=Mesorhizobium sp. TaxID=1871066 RepID=UPI000FE7F204|nr:hypothetical protein [Mesorhizobium sp.]RWL85481.1 MAG: hypothetical protein EOR69_07015 [Mesorhizobium sp.]RWL88968.1 MAG: hypothetical protein EOR67_09975 [Mesorhizobium sp.]